MLNKWWLSLLVSILNLKAALTLQCLRLLSAAAAVSSGSPSHRCLQGVCSAAFRLMLFLPVHLFSHSEFQTPSGPLLFAVGLIPAPFVLALCSILRAHFTGIKFQTRVKSKLYCSH